MLRLRTLLTPEELLDRLHELEAAANRERIIHWGPRTLDLDILFYDNEIIDTPNLHIPHIDMENRDFVLKPLDEIAPYYRHPVLNKTIHQLLNELLSKAIKNVKTSESRSYTKTQKFFFFKTFIKLFVEIFFLIVLFIIEATEYIHIQILNEICIFCLIKTSCTSRRN